MTAVRHALVAVARVIEERVRRSRRVRTLGRAALSLCARRSREIRDYVRVRVRPLV